MANEDLGNYIWRGGKKIDLEKTKDTFTTILFKSSDLGKLRDKVKSASMLHGNVAELIVEPTERDKLMEEIRSENQMIVHHEYLAKDSPSTKYTLTDTIIVKFKPEYLDHIMEIIDEYGLVIQKQYEKDKYLLKVTSAANKNPVKVANKLMDDGKVEYAEVNMITKFMRMYTPDDSLFKEQWHLSTSTLAADISDVADISASEAWEITRGKREIVIAVFDDGFDLEHPDFKGDGKIVSPKDYVDGDIRPFPGPRDYHGTPCAGVAIAEENGIGCVGAAPGCAFMPVRFDLNSSDDELITMFEYISENANIVSCSWGPIPGNYPLNTLLHEIISELAANGGKNGEGLVIVFAAGNFNAPLNLTVDKPIEFGFRENGRIVRKKVSGEIVNGFAAHPDVIAVAACTSLNKKAAYSNWGKEISIASPSNNSHPITLHRLEGRGITTTDNEIHGSGFTDGSEYTSGFGGTSSATPLVAGVAGLVLSVDPELTANQVKEILQNTADKIEDTSKDIILGTSKGTYDENGHSEWFGYGKVNAFRAVLETFKKKDGESTNTIKKEISPQQVIPDEDPTGTQSSFMINETGKIEDIKVKVNITHKYPRDLVVELISPNGEKAELLNILSWEENISKTYDANITKGVRSLLMKEAHGIWTLSVADTKWQHEGKLENWGLELALMTPGNKVIRQEINPVEDIPDKNANGIESPIIIVKNKKIADIKVKVDITHSYIPDLVINCISPSGTWVRLHNKEGVFNKNNIEKCYTTQNTPQLRQFLGENTKGKWVLKVADLVSKDYGKLNKWGLEISIED